MPKVDVPMREWDEIKGLRRNQEAERKAKKLVEITQQIKELQEEASELRDDLHPLLAGALTENESSVRLGDYRLTIIQGSPRRTLDKQKLLKYISAAKLEKCYTTGAAPKPTVAVAKVESREEQVTRKTLDKLESTKGNGRVKIR